MICSDCTANNVMLGASGMYPNGIHPTKNSRNDGFKGTAKAYTGIQRPPVYYLIDFGLSRHYNSRDVSDEPLRGGDKSAPEHRSKGRCNPFQTDIYYIGNLVRHEFMEVRTSSWVSVYAIDLIPLLEMLWFRVHGEFGQLDDIRRSGPAPSNRGGAQGVYPHSRNFKSEQAALPHNVEESTQDLWGGSTGEAIPSHDAIGRVASPRYSRPCFSTRLTSYNILNHSFTIP
jgi:hypothetical protein